MKSIFCNIKGTKIFVFCFMAALLSACTTSSVMVRIQRPADITLSKEIKNVVVVNRSRPSKDNRAGNIIEGLVTGEGIGADRKGAEYCINGLSQMLNNSTRFNLKNVDGIELKGTGTSSFPLPLDWDQVKSICGSYDGDALLVLETFDSDSRKIVHEPHTRVRKIKGVKVKSIIYPATLFMEIESGWRVYDVNKQRIVDENKFIEIKEFTSEGGSPEEALLNLPSKMSALRRAGLFAGEQYGFRISPIWIRVDRTYYIGKHEELKQAKYFVKTGDWDAAIEIWKLLVESEDLKLAKRAAFNLALASEIKGALDTAIDWAKKAQQLGESKAHNYINVLHRRKMDEEKLRKQLIN